MEKANYKQLLPLIMIGDKTHQILLNDKERKEIFNRIADLRGKIELDHKIFCEITNRH